MITTNNFIGKADKSVDLTEYKDFLRKYKDEQVIAYVNPNSFLPSPIVMLYKHYFQDNGYKIAVRWPTGYEGYLDKDKKELIVFESILFEKDEIILKKVEDAKPDVLRQYKYDGSRDVQLAWCNPYGQIYIGSHQEMVDSYKLFLQDEEMNDLSREIVMSFLKAEDNINKEKN